MENMNMSADPCEDFYAFSCGSFASHKRIQDDQTKIDELYIIRESLAMRVADLLSKPIQAGSDTAKSMRDAKRLFASCLNEQVILYLTLFINYDISFIGSYLLLRKRNNNARKIKYSKKITK